MHICSRSAHESVHVLKLGRTLAFTRSHPPLTTEGSGHLPGTLRDGRCQQLALRHSTQLPCPEAHTGQALAAEDSREFRVYLPAALLSDIHSRCAYSQAHCLTPLNLVPEVLLLVQGQGFQTTVQTWNSVENQGRVSLVIEQGRQLSPGPLLALTASPAPKASPDPALLCVEGPAAGATWDMRSKSEQELPSCPSTPPPPHTGWTPHPTDSAAMTPGTFVLCQACHAAGFQACQLSCLEFRLHPSQPPGNPATRFSFLSAWGAGKKVPFSGPLCLSRPGSPRAGPC